MTDRGTYIKHSGRPAVRFERTYPHPIERVWAAITNPEELRHWFPSELSFEPHTGGVIRFSGDPNLADDTDIVIIWDPPHRFAFGWGGDEIHLELTTTTNGCRLILVNVLADDTTAARNATGWYGCLAELRKVVDGEPGDGPHGPPEEFWPIYDAHVADGLPHGAWIPEEVLAARPDSAR